MAQLYGKKTSTGLPKALECTDGGALNIAVSAQTPPTTLPLPTGAATSALQTAGNASLAAIATKKVQLHAKIDFSSVSAQTIIAARTRPWRRWPTAPLTPGHAVARQGSWWCPS